MSKLAERVPTMVDTRAKVELVGEVVDVVASGDGRIDFGQLVDEVEKKVAELEVNEERLVKEGRRSAAQQIASAWANLHTITVDRSQRRPVYQGQFGFAQSYFKVGSVFVPPAAMTIADFETMLDRQARRIENAQTDQSIWRDFYERARPGLERGENLVQQFESGALELGAADGNPALEAGEAGEAV